MLTNKEEERVYDLVRLVNRLSNYMKDYNDVVEYVKTWDVIEPQCTIKHLKECFKHKKYSDETYHYKDLNDVMRIAKHFIPIVKEEVFYIMEVDFNKGWKTITADNCDEITEQLNKDLSIQVESERLTNKFLGDIK